MSKFKFDPNSTKNEGRWRLKDPKEFKEFFRQKSITRGISYIIGIPHDGGLPAVQSIRFNKKIFTQKKAALWWNRKKFHFNKTWKASDWGGEDE